jgi:hypothetical protein
MKFVAIASSLDPHGAKAFAGLPDHPARWGRLQWPPAGVSVMTVVSPGRSLDDHEPLKLLKTSGSFRQDELKLLDYAVMKSDWSAGKKKWPSLCAKIAKQKWIRNAAAHSSLGFRYENDAKKMARQTNEARV